MKARKRLRFELDALKKSLTGPHRLPAQDLERLALDLISLAGKLSYRDVAEDDLAEAAHNLRIRSATLVIRRRNRDLGERMYEAASAGWARIAPDGSISVQARDAEGRLLPPEDLDALRARAQGDGVAGGDLERPIRGVESGGPGLGQSSQPGPEGLVVEDWPDGSDHVAGTVGVGVDGDDEGVGVHEDLPFSRLGETSEGRSAAGPGGPAAPPAGRAHVKLTMQRIILREILADIGQRLREIDGADQ